MARPDEVTRNRAFWREQRSRDAAKVARLAALNGNNAAAQTVRDGWNSVVMARQEADIIEREDEDDG
jgi:hypothetical protein